VLRGVVDVRPGGSCVEFTNSTQGFAGPSHQAVIASASGKAGMQFRTTVEGGPGG